MLASTALRLELIPRLECAMLVTIASKVQPRLAPKMESWAASALLVAIVRRAQPGPNTAREATITRTQASKRSLIAHSAHLANGVKAKV